MGPLMQSVRVVPGHVHVRRAMMSKLTRRGRVLHHRRMDRTRSLMAMPGRRRTKRS